MVIFSDKEGVGVRVKQGLGANAGCDLTPVGDQDPVVPSCSYQIKKDSLQTHRMYRVNPDVSYGLWVIMCPRRFINGNTCAPVVRGVDSGAGGVHVWGQ